MKKGRRSTIALGIQIGSYSIRLVALERTRKGIQLKQCCERPFPNGIRFAGAFDSHIKNSCIQTLQSLLSDIRVRSEKGTIGIDSRNVILKRIPVDSWLEDDELQHQVLWEAEQLLVDPLDNYILDFHIQDVNETMREVVLAVAQRKTVEDYAEILEKSGLVPFCIDIDLFALSNAYEHLSGNRSHGAIALIDVEPDAVRCVIVRDGLLSFAKLYESSTATLDFAELLDAATHRMGETLPLNKVVVSGSETVSEEFISELSVRCNHPVERATPSREMKTESKLTRQQLHRETSSYMIGIGLALRGITEL